MSNKNFVVLVFFNVHKRSVSKFKIEHDDQLEKKHTIIHKYFRS